MKRPRENTYHFPFHCDKFYNHFHFLSKLGRCVKRLRVNTYHFPFHCDKLNHFHLLNNLTLERDSLTQNKREMCKKTEGFPGEIYSDSLQ